MQTSSFKRSVSLVFLVGFGHFGCGQATDARPGAAPTPAAGASDSEPTSDPTSDAAGGAPGGAAAGSPGAAAAAAPGEAPAPVVSDRVPPEILSVTPANGAVGVKAGAPIVISFSEPMDQRATLDAFASETLPRTDATLSWNEAGTTLTIQPHTPLEYAHATRKDDEPLELDARRYGYSLTRFATDLAGNPLAETRVTFSTLRDVTHTLSAVPALTGVLQGTGDDTRMYGFISFDTSLLPSGIVALERAATRCSIDYVTTDAVPIHRVEFDALTPAAIDAGPGTLLATLPPGTSGNRPLSPTLNWADDSERGAARRYSQYRLDLVTPFTPSAAGIAARVLGATSVELEYLLP